MTATQFLDWNVFIHEEEQKRSKQDGYFVAIRHDLHQIIALLKKFMGDNTAKVPEVEKLFLTEVKAVEEKLEQVPGHGYGMEGDAGDYEKGYGLPGIEVGKTPLDAKWQQINDQEKLKWQGLMATGAVQMVSPSGV